MIRAINFYDWFKGLGGDTKNLDVANLVTALNNVHVQVSSFKQRKDEIKTMFNHKFN